jgi:regulator of CtrA degradation
MKGSGKERRHDGAIDFLEHFAASDQFSAVFKEGMGLVEETANYLDGQGRRDARLLDRTGSISYATESMRLTTRLMQLASWLLLQRAVNAGELSPDEAKSDKHRIGLTDVGAGYRLKGGETLPEALVGLVDRSLRLHERIQKLDRMLNEPKSEQPAENAVSGHIDRLAAAFGRRGEV